MCLLHVLGQLLAASLLAPTPGHVTTAAADSVTLGNDVKAPAMVLPSQAMMNANSQEDCDAVLVHHPIQVLTSCPPHIKVHSFGLLRIFAPLMAHFV